MTVLVRLCLVAAVVLATPAAAQIASTFDTDDEGWSVQDCDCYTDYTIQYGALPVTWSAAGGDPGGHVVHVDETNYCSFFAAPAAFLGDQSANLGRVLEFSLQSTASNWETTDVVVLIGAGMVACHELPELPPAPPQWRHYTVPLVAASFTYDDEDGAPVTPEDLAAILADLQQLLIPAEFGAAVTETVGLDSVRMGDPVTSTPELAPAAARLLAAWPNPFNPATTVAFELAAPGPVSLQVCDARGRRVRVLVAGRHHAAGRHEVRWDGRDERGRHLAAGVYLARLAAGGARDVTKLVLVQ